MKHFGIAVGFTMLALAGVALADNIPFHAGTFRGQWCDGNPVIYYLRVRRGPSTWMGRIQDGDDLDRVQVDQLRDGSLRIVRFLSGTYDGQIQEILTRPAAVRVLDGQVTAQYWAAGGIGSGCGAANADLRMPMAVR